MPGNVVGVAAVATMLTLGNGASRSVQAQIAGPGCDLPMVLPGQRMGSTGAGGPAFNIGHVEAIGVLFGYVPARRAARLDPIDALRHEWDGAPGRRARPLVPARRQA